MRAFNLKTCLLASAAILAISFAVRGIVRFSSVKTVKARIPAIDMICTECGHETILAATSMPMRCPACGKRTLVIAAYCPGSGVTLPLLDSDLYYHDGARALNLCPEKVFPKSPVTGKLMMPKFHAKRRPPTRDVPSARQAGSTGNTEEKRRISGIPVDTF